MHPGFYSWWKRHRHEGCGEEGSHAGCGGGWRGAHADDDPRDWARRAAEHDGGGSGFGVRRPLRFLAYKLELDEKQVAELARILSELKTERAQAEVDGRRSTTAFADAIAGEAFDAAKADEAGTLRVKTAERLREAVSKALKQMHAVLSAEQRDKLAYLIRTGTVSI